MDIQSYETFSTKIKVLSYSLFLPRLIRPLGLYTQAFKHGIIITFVNTLCFNYPCKWM